MVDPDRYKSLNLLDGLPKSYCSLSAGTICPEAVIPETAMDCPAKFATVCAELETTPPPNALVGILPD